MMLKRMGKHPVYWILLLLFPAAVFFVPRWNGAVREEQILVGYVMSTDAAAKDEKQKFNDALFTGIEDKLSEAGTFQYTEYEDVERMKEGILRGELSCGVSFDETFAEKLREQNYHHCITLYLPEGMNVGGMVQEDLFGRVYQAYSAVWYAELLREQGYQIDSEQVLQKFSEYQSEGKVFAVDYEEYGGNENEVQNSLEDKRGASMLSLRGILAFLTFLSAMLGALDGARDRKRTLGKGISCPGRLTMAAAGAPILPAALLLAAGMIVYHMTFVSDAADRMTETMPVVPGEFWLREFLKAEIVPEFSSALLYGLILWLCAMAVSRLLPVKLLEGIAPCVLLVVLLCCPILFDLGETVPLIGQISKLFPVTWYLKFWG